MPLFRALSMAARVPSIIAAARPLAAFGEHRLELRPRLRRFVLLAELLDAVAPAARGDASGEARLDTGRVYRHRRAEAVAVHGDAFRIDFRPVDQELER